MHEPEPGAYGDAADNREFWTRANAEYTYEHANRAWAADEITWGVFNVPDHQLGDVSGLDAVRPAGTPSRSADGPRPLPA